MPELPEVETVRRGLAPRLIGRRIARVTLRRPDLRFPLPADFAEQLTGRQIIDVGRRAKYLLISCDDGTVLLSHLGMSGRYSFTPTVPPGPHDHVQFDLSDGTQLVYSDPRRFGFMDIIQDSTVIDNNRYLKALGIEPLGNTLSGSYLSQMMKGRRTPVKSALLDQRIIAGIGNIYACEALFRARLSPRRSAQTIAGKRADRLATAIREVLQDAIAAGGSSLKDFAGADGALGYFQHGFQVYDRTGQECVTAGCETQIRRIVQAGRSTFYCPACQR